MKKTRPRASSVGASPSKEGLSTHIANRSTWKKAATKSDKKVRYSPMDSAEALEEAIAAHDPYLKKEDPPMSDKVVWSEPPANNSAPVELIEPSPTPPLPGDSPQPESRG